MNSQNLLTSPRDPEVAVARLVVHWRGAATAARGSRGWLAEGGLLRLRLLLRLGSKGRLGLGSERRLGLESRLLELGLERRLGLELRPEGWGSLGRRAAGEGEEVSVSVVELSLGDAGGGGYGHQGHDRQLHPDSIRNGLLAASSRKSWVRLSKDVIFSQTDTSLIQCSSN